MRRNDGLEYRMLLDVGKVSLCSVNIHFTQDITLAPSFRRMPESRDGDRGSMVRQPCVYLLANKRNGTLYTGVTSNVLKRVWEHKNNVAEGFTRKYGVHTLVWYEVHETMESAILQEKTIKNWKRAWKIKVIEEMNPQWRDLYPDL